MDTTTLKSKDNLARYKCSQSIPSSDTFIWDVVNTLQTVFTLTMLIDTQNSSKSNKALSTVQCHIRYNKVKAYTYDNFNSSTHSKVKSYTRDTYK